MTQIKILVAEDDANIRMGLVDTLESENYQVMEAKDGSQALELFHNNSFDLLLLDIMMQGKSGYYVCQDIRALDQDIPCIMLTAKGEEFDDEEWASLFKQAGAKCAGRVAVHHDNFCMWDSSVSYWNAVQ